ncbi:MAG: ferritin-like domain-containing protein [Solirubrobacteraceae bacterium]
MTEPKIVVANREDLWYLLAEAAQLEHMIMCQYLYAEFSLKDGTEEGLNAEQADAVERWRKVLRGIAVEEMLHLALVANVMTSIGAVAPFGRPNFPQRSGYFPSGVQLDLLPFGERALLHFLYLERPEGMERQDAEGFVPVAPPRQQLSEEEAMPRGQEFMTVGHLYRGIEDGLRGLASRLGEHAVFVGSPRAQARPEIVQWPQLIAVTGLDSALSAIGEIIEQGEGARGDWRDAHYGRFLGIWQEYHELRRRDPAFEPALPVLPAYTRQPFDIRDLVPVVTDPLAHRVAEVTTVAYELVLQLLLRFFTHTEETDEQLETLIGSAIELMAAVVRPLGTTLARLPFGPEHADRTAGFAFEMYYQMTNMVPWREPSWALLRERMSVLVDRCAAVGAHEGAPDVVHVARDQADSITAEIGAHVPSELLPGGLGRR